MILSRIPRNIFQTWESIEISIEMSMLTNSWKVHNPNYGYFFFDERSRNEFIQENFCKAIYDTYLKILPGAFRADLFRYCVLYIFGGVFADIDTICLNSIDKLIDKNIDFVTAIDLNNNPEIPGKYYLTNGFIASTPRHPILARCIALVVENVQKGSMPPCNLDFSGPGVLGRSVNHFLNLPENTSFVNKEGIHRNNILINGFKDLKLLKFDAEKEIMLDGETKEILLQNKNGNRFIQEIYKNELTKIEYIDWGTCQNPVKL
jgi:hypothetical protein